MPELKKDKLPKEDISGQIRGTWRVLEFAGKDRNRKDYYHCECVQCGNKEIKDKTGTLDRISKKCRKCYTSGKAQTIDTEAKPPKNDLTDTLQGNWYVIRFVGRKSNSRNAVYECRCIKCGNEKNVESTQLGKTTKCNQCRSIGEDNQFHTIWKDIKARCYNPNDSCYKSYGGRGITLFQPWVLSYIDFKKYILKELGERPEGYTLDRIDNEKGYVPGNLRWASSTTQSRNRRSNVLTAEKVAEIKRYYLDHPEISKKDIAIKYNLNITTCSDMLRGKTWKDVQPVSRGAINE